MKGDFSRETFDPKKHYSGVLMQQGRVQLDADWNEQGEIERYLFETEGTDVIGECGAPINNAGFQITTDGAGLFIGPGRFYASGILAENDHGQISYDQQADLPGADLKAELATMAEQGRSLAIAYLDVWRRHVTPLDDPRLREVALGGPDTTTRLQTVWQVRLLPVNWQGSDPDAIGRLENEEQETAARLTDTEGRLTALVANITQRQEELAAVREGPARTRLEQTIQRLQEERLQVQSAHEELSAAHREISDRLTAARAEGTPTCSSSFPEWDELFAPHGKLNAQAKPGDPADDPCELPPGAGYTRLENQLYRVEVHQPGGIGDATFKWSRDNGTVVTAVEKISGSSVFVHDLGPDEVLGFANGQWVELSDDALELNGKPGQLCRVIDVKPATSELVLDPPPAPLAAGADGVDLALHPKLRRWDQSTGADADGIVTTNDWIPLEGGVEVQFSGGPFATGDYWVIPARTATGDLEWPPYEVPNLSPAPQDRRGIVHRYCRLALLRVTAETVQVLEDCRKLFPPLTGIQASAAPPAMHVIATNWDNDAQMDITAFLNTGLRIRLDAPPDPRSVDGDSVLVTLDMPYVNQEGPIPNARERIVLLGAVGIDPADPQTITWRWTIQSGVTLGRATTFTARATLAAAAVVPTLRLNVTLRGRVIWRQTQNQLIHVDGQAFAQPQAIPGTNNVRQALMLPSGDGARGSDFESWFFLGQQQPQLTTLRVARVEFISALPGQNAQVIETVDDFPLNPDKVVTMKFESFVNRVRVAFTREVQPQGEFSDGPQSAVIELLGGRQPARLNGSVVVKGDMVQFDARDPQVFTAAGTYRLTVLSQVAEPNIGIRADDDGSALDGDFEGQPGGNFTMPFVITGRG